MKNFFLYLFEYKLIKLYFFFFYMMRSEQSRTNIGERTTYIENIQMLRLKIFPVVQAVFLFRSSSLKLVFY